MQYSEAAPICMLIARANNSLGNMQLEVKQGQTEVCVTCETDIMVSMNCSAMPSSA